MTAQAQGSIGDGEWGSATPPAPKTWRAQQEPRRRGRICGSTISVSGADWEWRSTSESGASGGQLGSMVLSCSGTGGHAATRGRGGRQHGRSRGGFYNPNVGGGGGCCVRWCGVLARAGPRTSALSFWCLVVVTRVSRPACRGAAWRTSSPSVTLDRNKPSRAL